MQNALIKEERSWEFKNMERTISSILHRASRLGIKNETRFWSKEELQILYKFYPEEGTKICERLKNKDKQNIMSKASKLGIKFLGNRWDDWEINVLKKYYSSYGPEDIHNLFLSNRSLNSIMAMASKLKISYKKILWNKEEDDILLAYYPIEGSKSFKRITDKTQQQCKARVRVLNIFWTNQNWTSTEIELLKQYYPIEGENCYKRFNGRTKTAVRTRARILGIKSYCGPVNVFTKKILCVETGAVFNSGVEAQNVTGINKCHISSACNGKRSSAGGLHWKFIEENK